jgi:redox-sensitive bicupin YhaK (pirin superfamily)
MFWRMGEIIETFQLGFPWTTADPFLFCVHHVDAYPAGNEQMGPAASLAGRELGMDFAGLDGWRMYHGAVVPGFPSHPHRGFETVTIARRGLIDHSDSLGAAARFGRGDVQWLTAGRGIVHAEMFPLLDRGGPNPVELFQIWLNLPRADKLVEPHFSVMWASSIPVHVERDASGRATTVTVIAGALEGAVPPPPPPPRSWAARPEAGVAIWSIRMEPRASWTLPPAPRGVNRTLYVFAGGLGVGERSIDAGTGARLRPEVPVALAAGDAPAEALLLQGRPIGESVVQHGPFVMNSADEIRQAFADFQRTRFGGWPWPTDAPVHPRDEGRFARHADGRLDRAGPEER